MCSWNHINVHKLVVSLSASNADLYRVHLWQIWAFQTNAPNFQGLYCGAYERSSTQPLSPSLVSQKITVISSSFLNFPATSGIYSCIGGFLSNSPLKICLVLKEECWKQPAIRSYFTQLTSSMWWFFHWIKSWRIEVLDSLDHDQQALQQEIILAPICSN